jgi:uncharacterized protein with FMN-binding domain
MSTQPMPAPSGDPLLERAERLERLERLTRRRPANGGEPPRSPAGSTLPSPPTTVGPSTNRPPRTKRHHPAKLARLGALAVSCATTGGLTYLFAGINESQATAQSLAALPTPVNTTQTAAPTASTSAAAATTTSTGGTSTAPAETSTTTPTTTSTGIAASTAVGTGTMQAFDGDVVNTRYGPVQVQVQITGGAISEVAVIEYPAGDGKSVRINARALPTLRTEALAAQSANIDTVSGATYTSDAYAVSLQAAIDQARLAGATSLA